MLAKNIWKMKVANKATFNSANVSRITFISQRGFSDKNGEPKKDMDWQFQMTDQGMKTFQQFNEYLFPADQVKVLTNKQVLQEIVRSNHLAQETMKTVSKGLKELKNPEKSKTAAEKEEDEVWGPQDFFSDYKQMHDSGHDLVKDKIHGDNLRSRPSVLCLVAPILFKGISVVNTQLWGEERAKKVLAGVEKGIQNECDENLRIMNEKNMTGRPSTDTTDEADTNMERDKQVRQMLLNIRDESYDFTEKQQISVDEDKSGTKEDTMPKDQYYLYMASKYVTQGMMRLSRKI